MDNLFAVAEQFKPAGPGCTIVDVREFGSGNINSTFLVTMEGCKARQFILQRINTQVFRRPDLVMRNMKIATDHLRSRLDSIAPDPGRRWEVPLVLSARDGGDHWRDSEGSFWRALTFIEGITFDIVKDGNHAREVGYALGLFHKLLSDLPVDNLVDTLEGFHITPDYLRHYNEILPKSEAPRSSRVDECLAFVSKRAAWASVLEEAKAQGRLSLRPIHGDPKVNNIMIDKPTGRAIGIVDLDTIKPGLVHYDIGDCLRSGCNPLGEETQESERVRFDAGICRSVLRGYIEAARGFLSGSDFDYMYDAIRLIGFELGLRFFTDYLEGNVYFRVRSPEHNLMRALVQFRLVESIEEQESAIRGIIREFM